MEVTRRHKDWRRQSNGRSYMVAWFYALVLAVHASEAAEPLTDTQQQPAAAEVRNVALGRDGVLRGRVFESAPGHLADGHLADGRSAGSAAGLPVKLLRNGKTVAVATTGRQGQFALQNLPEGLYRLLIDDHGRTIRRFCRVWNSSAAPPQAGSEIRVPIGGPVTRAQYPSPFPIVSLRQAAVVTGIAAGAIAAPAIYHNARIDNKGPSTP